MRRGSRGLLCQHLPIRAALINCLMISCIDLAHMLDGCGGAAWAVVLTPEAPTHPPLDAVPLALGHLPPTLATRLLWGLIKGVERLISLHRLWRPYWLGLDLLMSLGFAGIQWAGQPRPGSQGLRRIRVGSWQGCCSFLGSCLGSCLRRCLRSGRNSCRSCLQRLSFLPQQWLDRARIQRLKLLALQRQICTYLFPVSDFLPYRGQRPHFGMSMRLA